MTILNKGTLIGFAIGLLTVAGFVYAAQTITSLTQTAVTGDKISANWVNAVNTRIGAVSAAGGGNITCVGDTGAGYYNLTCVNTITGKKCNTNGGDWYCVQNNGWAP